MMPACLAGKDRLPIFPLIIGTEDGRQKTETHGKSSHRPIESRFSRLTGAFPDKHIVKFQFLGEPPPRIAHNKNQQRCTNAEKSRLLNKTEAILSFYLGLE
jgi:hypothetical protein